MYEIALLAFKAKASKTIFENTINKITDLRKENSVSPADLHQQIAGYIHYQQHVGNVEEADKLSKTIMLFYLSHSNQLTDRTRKHDFFNQFLFLFYSF